MPIYCYAVEERVRGHRSNDAVKEALKNSVLFLGELQIKGTLCSPNRGTDSWADSISSFANLINMWAFCKSPEEVDIRKEIPIQLSWHLGRRHSPIYDRDVLYVNISIEGLLGHNDKWTS